MVVFQKPIKNSLTTTHNCIIINSNRRWVYEEFSKFAYRSFSGESYFSYNRQALITADIRGSITRNSSFYGNLASIGDCPFGKEIDSLLLPRISIMETSIISLFNL